MARRTGSADLPLHGGRVPAWLGQRMSTLGAVICQAVVHHYGRDEFLRRLSYPFWFQSFGAVMGMDWHSSGITTSVIGALKRGLAPLQAELGIHVCGGRGKHSRKTPDELMALGDRIGIDAFALIRASRLVAKVDSAAVQEPIVTRTALPGDSNDHQARYIEAAIGSVLVGCIYLPNGNLQPGPKFQYKLAWFKRLQAYARKLLKEDVSVVLAGDYNVAPTEIDIYPTTSWNDDALV